MLGWIGLFLSTMGIYLNANKDIRCWHVWLLSNVFWVLHSISNKDLASVCLWILFAVFNVYGLYKWKKEV